jgi:hydroxypyruvate isomerase
MPNFSAHLSMLFTEMPFRERFNAAARAGFKAVEFMFPYDYSLTDLKDELLKNDLQLVFFNMPAGNWAAGDRGTAVNPARKTEFQNGLAQAMEYAVGLGVTRLNCLVGKKPADCTEKEQRQTLIENLRFAADALAGNGINLMVEQVNNKDVPGFFLNTARQVADVLAEVDRPNVSMLCDVYHAQRMEGDLAGILNNHLAQIGHIHIADNPGRHQPGTGEINYRFFLNELDRLGYQGYVGMEYAPVPDTIASLGWIAEHGYSL